MCVEVGEEAVVVTVKSRSVAFILVVTFFQFYSGALFFLPIFLYPLPSFRKSPPDYSDGFLQIGPTLF